MTVHDIPARLVGDRPAVEAWVRAKLGRDDIVFERDLDDDYSIEIYATPDESGSMEHLGRLSLFGNHLITEAP